MYAQSTPAKRSRRAQRRADLVLRSNSDAEESESEESEEPRRGLPAPPISPAPQTIKALLDSLSKRLPHGFIDEPTSAVVSGALNAVQDEGGDLPQLASRRVLPDGWLVIKGTGLERRLSETLKLVMALAQNALRSTRGASPLAIPPCGFPSHPVAPCTTDNAHGVVSFVYAKQNHFVLDPAGRSAVKRIAATFLNCPDELNGLKTSVQR